MLGTLPLKVVGEEITRVMGKKGQRGGLLWFNTGNLAAWDFVLVSCIDSYLAAAGLSHSR